ncbi:MAG: hypothetical protein HY270_02060 [Deltaproteobacteria bacterium]|nr:hypothetical protein [Deltaproteobacteria bacterium]
MTVVAAARAQTPGDCNCDSVIDGSDLSCLAEQVFGETIPACANPDANGDQRLTGADIETVVRLIAPPALGPTLTYFGLANAGGSVILPAGSENGLPVFTRRVGAGFQVVVETRAGANGRLPGLTTYNTDSHDPSKRPDLQVEVSNPLGDGSRDVCLGGVPAVNPPDFGSSQRVADAINDLGCNFALSVNGSCVQNEFGQPVFVGNGTQAQFCLLVSRSLLFPEGDTILTVHTRDVAGNLGPAQQLILRVGDNLPTHTPSRTPTWTITRAPTATRTPTASPPRTSTPTRTYTFQTPSTPTRTPSSTPTQQFTTTPSVTPSRTPTLRFSLTPTRTPSPTQTPRFSFTSTATLSPTPSPSIINTATRTPSRTAPRPTETPTPTLRTPPATATASRSPTRTDTAVRTATFTPTTPGSTVTRSGTATRTPSRTLTFSPTATLRPATFTPTQSLTATRTRTATATRTASSTAPPTRTFTMSPTMTPTRVVSPKPTPTGVRGPVISFFGITRADDTLVPASDNKDGVDVFTRAAGAGFSLIVEGRPGANGVEVGRSSYDESGAGFPDLQIVVSRALGDGSPTVCDRVPPSAGGVPAIDPPSFDAAPSVIAAVNDLACRFVDGSDQPFSRGKADACILFPDGNFSFAGQGSTTQFCGFVDAVLHFPAGDTQVTARLRDTQGNPGPTAQIIIRISQ